MFAVPPDVLRINKNKITHLLHLLAEAHHISTEIHLHPDQAIEDTLSCHQLIVRTRFSYTSFIKDNDPVGFFQG